MAMRLRDLDEFTNTLSSEIIACAVEVQRELGPGLLEAPYRAALAEELRARGRSVVEEAPRPVAYKTRLIDVAYKIDIIVEDRVVIEVKAVQSFHPRHEAQLINYMRLSGCRLGILLNFHARLVAVDGFIRRVV